MGFWTPEYLEAKARKVTAAGLDHLILVVYRGLAVGKAGEALEALACLGARWWDVEELLSSSDAVMPADLRDRLAAHLRTGTC